MSRAEKISLFALRLSIGWVMFYAGFIKIIDPSWTAAGYLSNAKTFTAFYQFLLSPSLLPIINIVNEWALLLLGISLILGLAVRLSGVLGAALMFLYYFPVLSFPTIAPYSFIIDDHIIYALVLLYLAFARAGRIWGLEKACARLPICSRFPKLRAFIG